jgi:hypothetical protein
MFSQSEAIASCRQEEAHQFPLEEDFDSKVTLDGPQRDGW